MFKTIWNFEKKKLKQASKQKQNWQLPKEHSVVLQRPVAYLGVGGGKCPWVPGGEEW